MKSINLFAVADYTIKVRPTTINILLGVGLGLIPQLIALPTSIAQPIIPEGAGGTGTQVIQQGDRLLIDGGRLSGDGSNLFHSFDKFSVQQGQVADFLSNPEIQNIFGRVFGGDASFINGVLQVTGGDSSLYLMNPAGFLFGADAQLNLPASFTATTAAGIQFDENWFSATGTNPYEALSGPATGFSFGTLRAGTILNSGQLEVDTGHSLTLLGGSVVNTGQLSAPAGQVLVTAVPESGLVKLQAPGSVLSLEIDPTKLGAGPNEWAISAADLPTLLTQQLDAASEFPGVSVAASGKAQLEPNGVQLPNEQGLAVVSGQVDVSGEQGGTVGVFGSRVGLVEGEINASGLNGGGEVLLGGEFQGKGPEPNAQQTVVSRGGVIAADAIERGDGGRVIVWADGGTVFEGNLSARGGAESGNGGFAEISGKENLVFDGAVNLNTSFGLLGTLLLDPKNVLISDTESESAQAKSIIEDTGLLSTDLLNPPIFEETTTIRPQTIRDKSANSNVEIQATNDILIGDLPTENVNYAIPGSSGDTYTVSIPTLNLGVGNGSITFTADSDSDGEGNFGYTQDIDSLAITERQGFPESNNSPEDFKLYPRIVARTADPAETVPGSITFDFGDGLKTVPNNNGGRTLKISGASVNIGGINLRNGASVGGNLFIEATNGNLDVASIGAMADNTAPDNAFDAGSITLVSHKGSIDTSRGTIDVGSDAGQSGVIQLFAEGDITTAELISRTITEGSGGSGEIIIQSLSGKVDTTRTATSAIGGQSAKGIQGSTTGSGEQGGITITAARDVLVNQITSGAENSSPEINIESKEGNVLVTGENPRITSRSQVSAGGNINLISQNGKISIEGIIDSSGVENAGNITLDSPNEVEILSPTEIEASSPGNPGDIEVKGPVNLKGDLTFRSTDGVAEDISSNIFFEAPVSGEGSLEIKTRGEISFSDDVDVQTIDFGTSGKVNIAGNITTAGESIEFSSPVKFSSDSQVNTGDCSTTGGCSIVLDGTVEAGERILTLASDRVALNTTINASQLNLLTDDIELNATINSSEGLSIAPRTSGRDIYLGQENTAGLSLTTDEISRISGTGNLQIGNEDAGNIFANDVLAFNTPAILQPGSDRFIQVQQDITTVGDRLTFNGLTQITDDVTISSAPGSGILEFGDLVSSENGNHRLTLSAGGGRIQFAGDVGAGTPFEQLTIESAAGVDLAGDVTTIEDLAITQPLVLEDNVALRSTGGSVTVDSSSSPVGADFTLNSSVAVTTGNLASQGGAITLGQFDSPPSSIAAGDITTPGGDISLIARDLINTGTLQSSNRIVDGGNGGDGGDVFIDPENDITIAAINAQGGINGTGGTVDLTTASLFRADSSFTDQNGINASISAAGGVGEGQIVIRHGGGDLFEPFDVGIPSDSDNRTEGALTTGANNVISGRSFPGSYTQGNIRIVTSDRFTQVLPKEELEPQPEYDANRTILGVEEYFTRRFEKYIGQGETTRIKSLEEIQSDLRDIEIATEGQTKPALIYVVFEPKDYRRHLQDKENLVVENTTNQGYLLRFEDEGSDEMQLILVTSDDVKTERVSRPKANRANATGVVELARRQIFRSARFFPKIKDYNYLAEANELYSWLLQPLERHLDDINNLVYILEPGLRSTPLAALSMMHDGEDYIIEDYSLAVMPSFSLTETKYKPLNRDTILLAGTNEFQSKKTRNLKYVEDELNAIQNIWGKPRTRMISGKIDFNRANLVQTLQNYTVGVVHLATHADFRPGDPNNSSIELTDDTIKLEELREILPATYKLNLLVLSSCDTASSSNSELTEVELGFSGLSVQAGVNSSLGSLWKVSDEGTAELMRVFYKKLQEQNMTKSQALRLAQQELLNSSSKQHPYYWSGFTIVGNPW